MSIIFAFWKRWGKGRIQINTFGNLETSDTICLERCCNTTLPFVLDDPKSVEAVSEQLVDLCNRRLMGNVPSHSFAQISLPRGIDANNMCYLVSFPFTPSLYLYSIHRIFYLLVHFYRYSSRALLIPFSKPSIGPTTEEESAAFSSLAATQQAASSAVGWIISLGKAFVQCGKSDISNRILPFVRSTLSPRLCIGYASLLFFAEKVFTVS